MARKWWTLLAVCTGVFMLLLDITIVNVALPYIQQAFHASLADLQWVIDAYALTLAAFLLTAGSIADLVGRRLVFAVGIVVFTLGSALCGVAAEPTFLALSRAFQGIGGAIMFATSLALLADAFPPTRARRRVRGVRRDHRRRRGRRPGARRRPHQLAVVALDLLREPADRGLRAARHAARGGRVQGARRAAGPDWLGFVTFTLGLTALVFGLIRSHPDGWGSTTVVGSLIAAAVLLAAFVVVELRSARPDARPQAAARPDVQRRPDRRVRDLGLAVLAAHATSSSTCRTCSGPRRSTPACGCCR